MKKLLFLLLLPLGLMGQEIPKGVSKIVIENNRSAKDNFNHAVSVLLDNGYFFEQRDSTIGVIKTQAKALKGSGSYSLNIRTIDNQIQITGNHKLGMDLNLGGVTVNDDSSQIKNIGAKGSLYRKSFTEMDLIAGKFTGSKSYH